MNAREPLSATTILERVLPILLSASLIAALFVAFKRPGTTPCLDALHVHLTGDGINAEKLGIARGFLWRHWREKRCAELYVTGASKEGVPFVSVYAISAENRKVFMAREVSWQRRGRIEKSSLLIDSVKRARPRNPHWDPLILVSDETSLAATDYRIVLSNENGKDIEEF